MKHPTPCLSASPSLEVDSRQRQAGAMLLRPSPRLPPPPPLHRRRWQAEQGGVGPSNSPPYYLPTPRSPVWPLLGPALSEMGGAAAF
jgi:hypothetical protein